MRETDDGCGDPNHQTEHRIDASELLDLTPPTVGSLYSGIGGWDLGFARAGWLVRWQCEINPYRRAVLDARFGQPIYEDGLAITEVPSVDALVTACPSPASDFASDAPIYEAIWRIIPMADPTFVIVEATHTHHRHLQHALRQIDRLGFDTCTLPVLHGSRICDPHAINWVRLLLIGIKHGAPGTDRLRTQVFGQGRVLVTGDLTTDDRGGLSLSYGALNNYPEVSVEDIEQVATGMGFPERWLLCADVARMATAVIETTAVPIAYELAVALAQPPWKG